jgi:hypothetical protein
MFNDSNTGEPGKQILDDHPFVGPALSLIDIKRPRSAVELQHTLRDDDHRPGDTPYAGAVLEPWFGPAAEENRQLR